MSVYMIRPTICFEIGDIYFGSTIQSLQKRFNSHKSDFKNKKYHCKTDVIFEKYGTENTEIIKLENCNNLIERESYYIRRFKCVNKCVPNMTKQEYKKINGDKIKEYMAKYRIDKRDEIKQTKDEYMKNVGVIYCECGGKYANLKKSRHNNTKKHQSFINSK